MIPAKLPFVVHAVVETVAALSFIFKPDKQLPGCNGDAKLILRQYGGLLLSTNFVCFAVLIEPGANHTTQLLAIALGTYHIWPCYRAFVRIRRSVGTKGHESSGLGGPRLHLAAHVICLGMFMFTAVTPME
ncbi:hypothetical protein F4779DRAFT_621498 [Xylariaceae sp. FL0662B]|nr:hypothetical protein F4779DRAFT_621498 [Xylariaceae sp. FL0662B]